MNFKNILFVAITITIIAGFTSCKKDKKDDSPSPTPKPFEHPFLKTGNYWVFETVHVDDNGIETFEQRDSSYIEKDTMINGVTNYKQVVYSYIASGINSNGFVFWRDSAGVLVNGKGEKHFDYSVPGIIRSQTITVGSNMFLEVTSVVLPGDTLVEIPAGTFSVKRKKLFFKIPDAPGVSHSREAESWYSDNVGTEVFSTSFFWNIPGTAHYQKSLVRYKVK